MPVLLLLSSVSLPLPIYAVVLADMPTQLFHSKTHEPPILLPQNRGFEAFTESVFYLFFRTARMMVEIAGLNTTLMPNSIKKFTPVKTKIM